MSQGLKPAVGACAAALLSLASLQAQNTVGGTSTGSGIGSGQRNLIWNSLYARIGGGFTNVIVNTANFSTIGGGYSNAVSTGATFATVGGGFLNSASANFATLAGGSENTASGVTATVGGGKLNTSSDEAATVAGGLENTAGGAAATVAGGRENTASGYYAAVGGGYLNRATNVFATIGGGENNVAGGNTSVIGGGFGNSAGGTFSCVPGGRQNEASGVSSFAAGRSAAATNDYSFVWSGSSGGVVSTNSNSFTVLSPGGARFITATNLVGVTLPSGGTAWAVLSDSNAKTGVHAINPRQILAKVAALPVTSWQYKHDPRRTYIGPMAQDFHAAFGLGGDDDKTITTLDTDGVTLAAIQGLVEELKERDAEIAGLKARNSQIEGQLREINQRLDRLPPAP